MFDFYIKYKISVYIIGTVIMLLALLIFLLKEKHNS